MQRFINTRAEQVHQFGFASGVPKYIARTAQRLMRLLIAARGWQDIRMVSRICRWANRPVSYGLPVHGKWFVTFEWNEDYGAAKIGIERR